MSSVAIRNTLFETARSQWEKSICDLESAISMKRLRIRGLEALVEDQKKTLESGSWNG